MKKVNLTDVTTVDGLPLAERYERFIGRFVDTGNPMHAYRTAFVVDRKATAQWVFDRADELLRDPSVAKRVRDLRDAAAAAELISLQQLINKWKLIDQADPNELISHLLDACRYCYGLEHKYQWKDMAEFAKAMDQALLMEQPLPDMGGGFGFDPRKDPRDSCPSCWGRGVGVPVMRDTTKLSPAGQALYEGVKVTRHGIEVIMADKHKARESLARILGAFKDGIPVAPVVPTADMIPEGASDEAQNKAYMSIIKGGAA